MRNEKPIFTKVVFTLAILSAGSILFNSIATHFYEKQVFIEREIFSPIEFFILIAFIFIVFFIVSSMIWLFNKIRRTGKLESGDFSLFLLGLFCSIILFGEKVMADEIGREMRLGWEATGELIIFNLLLAIQLVYSLLVLVKTTGRDHFKRTGK
jgi:hypothetical protein